MRSRYEIIEDAKSATGFALPIDGPVGLDLLMLEVLCDIRDTLGEISAGQDDIIKELQDRATPTPPELPPGPNDAPMPRTAAIASKSVGSQHAVGFRTPKLEERG